MLVAGHEQTFAGISMRYHLTVCKQLRLYCHDRTGLLFDTQFVPPYLGAASTDSVTFILLKGRGFWRSPHQPFEAPCVLRMSSELFDGAEGRRARTFCSGGVPTAGMIMFSANRLTERPPETPVVETVAGAEDVLAACADYHAAAFRGVSIEDLRARGRIFTDACVKRGLLTEDAPASLDSRWSRGVEVTFAAFHETWRTSSMLPSISDLARLLGLSDRQIARNFAALAKAFSVPWLRWRTATFDWRMREAVTFLSAANVTVTGVAKAVRYGSVESMGRAFRDAGLPAPIEVRAALRRTMDELERTSSPP